MHNYNCFLLSFDKQVIALETYLLATCRHCSTMNSFLPRFSNIIYIWYNVYVCTHYESYINVGKKKLWVTGLSSLYTIKCPFFSLLPKPSMYLIYITEICMKHNRSHHVFCQKPFSGHYCCGSP